MPMNPPGILKVDRNTKTLRELALEKMRDAILGRHFQPGERLVERALCDQLGVSRTVVREVLRHLEAEGLVETLPHQGPIVARLEPEQAAQIYELRAALEALAARACALHASAEDRDRLAAAMVRIERAFEAGELRAVLDATTDFYRTMFLSAGKTVAWTIVQSLNARISHLRMATLGSAGRGTTGPVEMRRIVDAIQARDAEAAEAACLDHVNQAARIALTLARPSDGRTEPTAAA
jgi:DNA-binding GntR family transcriptional regulator